MFACATSSFGIRQLSEVHWSGLKYIFVVCSSEDWKRNEWKVIKYRKNKGKEEWSIR
jgi:hypothetical protein